MQQQTVIWQIINLSGDTAITRLSSVEKLPPILNKMAWALPEGGQIENSLFALAYVFPEIIW